MNRLTPLERVRESNRQARDTWSRWALHRAHVMEVLTAVSRRSSHLCLLGAGQLNDVSLDELRKRYARITLADVDVETVVAALDRHGAIESAACRVCAPIDLTAIFEQLAGVAVNGVSVSQILATLAGHRCSIRGEPFDVTASLGTLTQLVQAVVDAGLAPSDETAVSLALRDKHLSDLVHLTRPGGTFALITDVVSTSTAPELLDATPAELEQQMPSLVAARNFFTGANPYRIIALLEESDRFREYVTSVRLVGPWLWAITEDRQHLTCAIVGERRGSEHSHGSRGQPQNA